ncbi:hypothetical protein FJO69_02090 [[Mycoplasma] falconis]|uniref:Uncharacterized protein n=1 Tax=[Mycoplasma] falconis TaxID=92403 RepID=A0A501XA81_9BACT|nr:hypothetical protein [[Mycoplasma] falconis]TPE57277.1 hypothetical protein FJO69_02090 [[Mycoplasma] falconis]
MKKFLSYFLLTNYLLLFLALVIYLPIFLLVITGQNVMGYQIETNQPHTDHLVIYDLYYLRDYILFVLMAFINSLFIFIFLKVNKNSWLVSFLPFAYVNKINLKNYSKKKANVMVSVMFGFNLLAIVLHLFFSLITPHSVGSLISFIIYLVIFSGAIIGFFTTLLILINKKKLLKNKAISN